MTFAAAFLDIAERRRKLDGKTGGEEVGDDDSKYSDAELPSDESESDSESSSSKCPCSESVSDSKGERGLAAVAASASA